MPTGSQEKEKPMFSNRDHLFIRSTAVVITTVTTIFALHLSLATASELKRDMALVAQASKAFINIVKKAKPAVVHIKVKKSSRQPSTMDKQLEDIFNNPLFEQFFGPYHRQFKLQPERRVQEGQGSGFIISPEGLILTNNHVVDQASSITVTLADDRVFDAKIIGADPQTDVALLKIDDSEDLPALPLGDSSKLEPGEWVIAIGNPFGLSQTVTTGVVSATGRSSIGINEYENFIQTDAAINPGNSGGPLLNGRGEAIGINTALFSRTGGYMGIGFAIPINMAKSVEQQLQKNGKVTRGWLGVSIQNMTADLANSFGLQKAEGVLISEVGENSPADRAGIHSGDVLTHINGEPLKDMAALRNKIAMMRPFDKADITLIRNGNRENAVVTIGEKPGQAIAQLQQSEEREEKSRQIEKFGLSLQELTERNRGNYTLGSGLLITRVASGSPADMGGLKRGQLIESINRRDLAKLRDLDKIMHNINSANKLLLRVRDGEYSTFMVLSTSK